MCNGRIPEGFFFLDMWIFGSHWLPVYIGSQLRKTSYTHENVELSYYKATRDNGLVVGEEKGL